MLLRFRFSNFRSFLAEQELSLIAGTDKSVEGQRFHLEGSNIFVLPVCAIFGPNASGKSNVIKALAFVKQAVLFSHRSWDPGSGVPVQMFGGSSDEATFEIDFVADGVRFQFGFSATKVEIVREWLFSYPHGRKQEWYSRTSAAGVSFGRALPGDKKITASMMRKNSLFLSTAAQNNLEAVLPIYRWFKESLNFDRSDEATTSLCGGERWRRQIGTFMASADLGITDLRLDPPTAGKRELFEKARAGLRLMLSAMELDTTVGHDPIGQLPAEPPDEVTFVHTIGGAQIQFDRSDESAGTNAYFSLLGPILRALESGSVLVIDELDSSLHTTLCALLIRLFTDKNSNPHTAQLIFTSHDATLLGDRLLAQDQVWLLQKNTTGASELYPLTDFRLRKDVDLRKRYLAGRFGGIPFVNAERIIEGIEKG